MIAVLGGGGCFALNFVREAEKQGLDTFGIGRSVKSPPFWLVHREYPFYRRHLVDEFESYLTILDIEKPEVIVNFAAQGEGAASFGDNAPDFFKTNTWALSRLVNELRKREYLKRFIHVSTSELYGSVDRPAKETEDGKGTSPYAISKQAFDDYLKTCFKIHGFPMNVVRPSNCYTPGQQLYRIIPKAIVFALSGKRLELHGGGKAQKSYLHATDLSKAILSILEKGTVGKVYNCGPSSPISIKTLVTHIAETCGVSWEELVDEVPDRLGQDSKYWLDSTEISKDTFWTPTVGLTRGLDEMIGWVKSFPELISMETNYVHRA